MKQAGIFVNDVFCGILPDKMKAAYCDLLRKRISKLEPHKVVFIQA